MGVHLELRAASLQSEALETDVIVAGLQPGFPEPADELIVDAVPPVVVHIELAVLVDQFLFASLAQYHVVVLMRAYRTVSV